MSEQKQMYQLAVKYFMGGVERVILGQIEALTKEEAEAASDRFLAANITTLQIQTRGGSWVVLREEVLRRSLIILEPQPDLEVK